MAARNQLRADAIMVPATILIGLIGLTGLVGLTGCSSGGDPMIQSRARPAAGTPTYQREVRAIFERSCVRCHKPGGLGPFSLQDLATARRYASLIRVAVRDRLMPPWGAGPGCTDYLGDPSLSAEQIQTVVRWIDSGMTAGNPSDFVPPTNAVRGLSRVDLALGPSTPYLPTGVPDDYRCFVLDWPETTDTYITGFIIDAEHPVEMHHAVAFVAPPDQVAKVEALDAADPGPGYRCFGGPGGGGKGDISGYFMGVIGVWGPNVLTGDLPPGLGIKVRPGSKVILQMHYNTAQGATPDQSKILFKIDRTVAKPTFGMPFTDPTWVAGQAMLIPAGQADVVHTTQIDPTVLLRYLPGNLSVRADRPVTLYATSFHEHLLGTRGRVDLIRKDGTRDCLLDVPRWDFHWQAGYRFAEPRRVFPGDQIRLECHWDNSLAHQPVIAGRPQPPRDVNFGEDTSDEMCVSGFLVSE
jgi:hypothetical protein